MKVIFEGSPKDIRTLLVNDEMLEQFAETSLNSQRADALDQELEKANETIQELSDKESSELTNLKKENAELKTKILNKDKSIETLTKDLHQLSTITWTEEQQIKLDKIFEETIEQIKSAPLSFSVPGNPKAEVTAKQVITEIFRHLKIGDRYGAVRVIREATGIPLLEIKALIDESIKKFGGTVPDSIKDKPATIVPQKLT